LVYEDATNFYPFTYTNDNGEPDGYNVALVKLLLDDLKIPYVIKLKPFREVLADIKSGDCDLTFGLPAMPNSNFGLYGHTSIALLTQSVATPKSKTVDIKTFHDLSNPDNKVTVSEHSACLDLMNDYGWADNAIVTQDMVKEMVKLNATQEGQVVWNTAALKWIIREKYLNNLMVTPVNMPNMDYRFLSRNKHLLDILDKTYSRLYTDGKMEELESKWFYPDRTPLSSPQWHTTLATVGILLLAVFAILLVWFLLQYRRVRGKQAQLSAKLSQIENIGHLRIWSYKVKSHRFYCYNQMGQVISSYSFDAFSHRYSREDFWKLREALERLASRHKDIHGHEEQQITLELQALDMDYADNKLHSFWVDLSVLRRNRNGNPLEIVAIKQDITEQRKQKTADSERLLRYWSMFYNTESGILFFDNQGIIRNANSKACELLKIDIDALVESRADLNTLFPNQLASLRDAHGYHSTINGVEYKMRTVKANDGELLGIFVFCV
jgi:PAS domain-containing protein/ABC-type amino acid transport substrate-binding protein